MTPDEERDLFRRLRDATGDARRRLMDEIVATYTENVEKRVSLTAQRLPRYLDIDDLRSEAMIGLWHAAESFDPERGVRFVTYAERRIIGRMLDWVRSQRWMPRQYAKTHPGEAETKLHSLHAVTANGSTRNLTVADGIEDDEPGPDAAMETKEESLHAMRGLRPRQRLALMLYHGDGLSMREIGRTLGVSESTTHHLVRGAERKMRERIN